jgi:hypothetical protein
MAKLKVKLKMSSIKGGDQDEKKPSDSTKQKYPSLKEKVDIAKKLYRDNPSKVFSDAVIRAEKNLTDSISKAEGIKASPDSTNFYTRRLRSDMNMADRSSGETKDYFTKKYKEDVKNLNRQSKKSKPGYDKDGFPIKK